MATSSLSPDFHIKQTVPKVPAVEAPHRRPASGRVGPYELVEEIGRGGMGVVYSARDNQGQLVALKVMRDANELVPGVAERFRREAQVLAQIRHPNIVHIHELGEHGKQLFLVMDFVKGGTLGEHVKRFLADCQLTIRTMIKVVRAVHHAHQHGILHRDLKPSNVLLDDQDEPEVTDFGLAKFPDAAPDLSRDGELIGTPAYMSPEQAAGLNEQIGPATDIWGLGVILYELLTGLRPFPGGDQSRMLFAIQNAKPLPPRQIRPLLDSTLEAIILRCLENKPANRYASASALADDLDRWQRGEPIPWADSQRWRQPKMVASLVFVVVAVALAMACLAIRGHSSPADQAAAAMQAKWQRGEKVELLGDGHLPVWHRWPLGPCQTLDFQPLALETYPPSLLELIPPIPMSRYRMRVEARISSLDLGASGLYFAHREQDTGHERNHFYCALLHAETDRGQRLTLEVHRNRESSQSTFGDFHSESLWAYPLPKPSTTISKWRDLEIEVTREQVTVLWKGQRVGDVSWGSVAKATNHLATLDPPVPSPEQLSPFLPGGVYVRSGSAAFRNFVVEPAE